MQRISIESTCDFTYGLEFSLLDAIEGQELDIKSNCRAGFCGDCKADLLDGEVSLIQQPCPLMPLKEGEILTCCCRPKTDIELRFKDKLRHMQW